ncbi:DNA cytosine methyltransferase [Nocardia terpenica]|uniref:Cytosine-specific methyltransferase n=1 Tax=Nocardia terpenica TaxID=455432 RepID=A0A164J8Y2_9NOCA|nr:DNA (cytosine-5-)-methyltransferase [Nocardia terpenica]KZM70161.1 cytosine methyltransferase [Nocardia terpenica]NQE91582.1 DNA (cytosine-5-)-methyltransferase [Nocardia terpenica]
MTELRVIEICAGAGGQALGLECAGFEHELAIELDNNAADTLEANRPHWKVLRGDVASTLWNPAEYAPAPDRRPIDLLAGGVPCPPFSIAGKQLGANDERDLFAWAVEQVDVIKPRALLLENVRGLSMPRFAGYRQHVLDRLRKFGYSAEWKLIQASDYGVPQLRPRFILIAMHPDDFAYFHWPEPAERTPTVGETLHDLMKRKKVFKSSAELKKWVNRANKIAPTIVGGSKKHGGADLGPTRAKLAWADMGIDAYGLHDDDKPYSPNDRSITDIGPKLTPEMVARIQGWNDGEFSWSFTGKKTAKYRQIGNAFPPPVAKSLGLAIAAALNHNRSPEEASENSTKKRPRKTASAPNRHSTPSKSDPVYETLRKSRTYMTASEIAQAAGLRLEDSEIERRIKLIDHDFIIHREESMDGTVYKLGKFRAFIGQDDHSRHEYFKSNKSKIS